MKGSRFLNLVGGLAASLLVGVLPALADGILGGSPWPKTGGAMLLNQSGSFVQNVPALPIVASRGMVPQSGATISGSTYDSSAWRIKHRVGRFAATNIRPAFVSAVIGQNHTGWTAQAQPYTVEWALEIANTSFKAGTGCTVPVGGKCVPGTGVIPSDLGIGNFSGGANIYSRGAVTGLTTGQVLAGGQAASVTTPPGSVEKLQVSAGQASQTNAFGDFSTTNWTAQAYAYSPQMILGNWVSTRDLSALAVGDSVVWGAGEAGSTAQLGEGLTGGGFLVRGLYSVSGAGKTVPWAKVALGGDAVVSANTTASRAILDQYLPHATDVFCDYFYNDINAAARTKEQVLADLIDYARFINSRGVRFHWTTPIPATTSTDNYATLANQTVSASYATAASYVSAGMRAAATTDPVVAMQPGRFFGGVIETRAAWADSVETDKWAVNGTANFYVFTDGIHPSGNGHALAAPVVAAYVNALSIP